MVGLLIAITLLVGFMIVLSVGLVSVIFDLSAMSCHAPPDMLYVPDDRSLDDERRGMNAPARSAPSQADLRNY
jgi:hypothetical protein